MKSNGHFIIKSLNWSIKLVYFFFYLPIKFQKMWLKKLLLSDPVGPTSFLKKKQKKQSNKGQTAVWGFPYLQAGLHILCLSKRRKLASEIRQTNQQPEDEGLILRTSWSRFSSQKLHRCDIHSDFAPAELLQRHLQWLTLQFNPCK